MSLRGGLLGSSSCASCAAPRRSSRPVRAAATTPGTGARHPKGPGPVLVLTRSGLLGGRLRELRRDPSRLLAKSRPPVGARAWRSRACGVCRSPLSHSGQAASDSSSSGGVCAIVCNHPSQASQALALPCSKSTHGPWSGPMTTLSLHLERPLPLEK